MILAIGKFDIDSQIKQLKALWTTIMYAYLEQYYF